MRRFVSVLLLLVAATPSFAQLPDAAGPGTRLTARGPTRSSTGAPGSGYWQQRVDYDVDAVVEPRENRISGSARITYYNNSPDTLQYLWWHLYQNLFRERVPGTRGMTIESIAVDNTAVTPHIENTLMRTPLPTPLLPGAVATIDIRWWYEPAPNTSTRSGREGNDFAIAQWYPQIATYDDQRGWDVTPYRGYEYYLEYGNWDARLTAPAEYVIAATGTLRNPHEVLTVPQQQRLAAVGADEITHIITREERNQGAAGATRTWHFSAEEVRDFVWAASPDFVWDAGMTNPPPDQPQGVIVHAFYKPNQASFREDAIPAGRHALELFSRRFGSYAYPQASLVSGPASGMEYPMLVFLSAGDPVTNQLAMVTAHELGHEWYPMMIGSHETAYPWMDEGFATYLEASALEDRFGYDNVFKPNAPAVLRLTLPRPNLRRLYQHAYLSSVRAGEDPVVMTHPHQLTRGYSIAAYQKPGTVLFMLEDVLGRETMDRALQEYYRRWRFRHPYPDDFFNTVEDVIGQDLDWFWNQWLVQSWQLDIAIDDVDQTQTAGAWTARVILENQGQAMMPVLLRLRLANGTTRDVRVPVSAWSGNGRRHIVTIDDLPARIDRAELDPGHMLADIDRLNDQWPRARVDFVVKPPRVMDMAGPIDAYNVSFWPMLINSRKDGLQIGGSIVGSYLGDMNRVSASATVGTRSGIVDWRAGYADALRSWSPHARWKVEAFRIDGRAGGELEVEWNRTGGQGATIFFADPSALRPRVQFGVRAIELRDDRYLRDAVVWERGRLVAATAHARAGVANTRATLLGGVRVELDAPSSSWSYGKTFAELRMDMRAPLGSTLGLRAAGGRISGAAPAQTELYLAQASPWERFGSSWFRSENGLDRRGIADETLMPGGGNIVGARPEMSGERLAAINAVLARGLFELFADAGDVWNDGDIDIDRWVLDAGIGLRIGLPRTIGPFDLARYSVYLRAPLWVRDPRMPERNGFDWRLRAVVGGRWGEM